MAEGEPLVGIGVPVHNGERFLRETLEALLAQDHESFELTICDNASSDQTNQICQEYLGKDERIRYFRSETLLGAAENFNRAFELSRGKYFMWAADHDLWDGSFIRKCVGVLEADPKVVLCYPQTKLIDASGNPLFIAPDRIDTRGQAPVERFRRILLELHWCNLVYGLIRTEAIRRTRLFPAGVIGGDHVFLAELSLLGSFAQIPEPLFLRRENREPETEEERLKRVLAAVNPRMRYHQHRMPHWVWLYKHIHMVLRAQVEPISKPRLLWVFWHCFPNRFRDTLRTEILKPVADPVYQRFGFDLDGFAASVDRIRRKVGWHSCWRKCKTLLASVSVNRQNS